MAAADAYQLPNPRIIDPQPGEFALAKDVGNPLAMLTMYRADRGLEADQYGQELAAQHAQARNALAATIANNAAERTIGAMTHPGGLEYLANNPNFAWMGNTPGTTNLASYATPDKILQMGNAVKPGAEGVKALGEGGFTPAAGDVGNVTGLTVNPSVPISVQAAQARGDAQKPPGYNMPMNIGVDATGKPVTINVQIPFGASPDETNQRVRQAIQDQVKINPGMKPNPGMDPGLFTPAGGSGASPPPPSSPPPPPPPATPATSTAQTDGYTLPAGQGETPAQSRAILRGKPVTNLSPAPAQPTQSTAQPAAQPASGTTMGQLVVDPNVQKQTKMLIAAKFPDNVKMDIADYMNTHKTGGQVPIFPKAGGGYVVLGMKGQYPLEQ